MEFEESRRKSLHIHQYKCKCSIKRWWGSNANNKCKKCGQTVEHLELKKTIGIGWFECICGRRYAGFCQGDVTSKCHGCQKENYASFIVPGDKADKEDDNPDKKNHYCAVCKGGEHCPIVEKVKAQRSGQQQLKGFFRKF